MGGIAVGTVGAFLFWRRRQQIAAHRWAPAPFELHSESVPAEAEGDLRFDQQGRPMAKKGTHDSTGHVFA